MIPTIERILAACPHCGSLDIKTRSSRAGGDGSRTSYCCCRACSESFNVLWEPPSTAENYFQNDDELLLSERKEQINDRREW